MMGSDEVAVFPSEFESGDVRLVYCPHRRVYELRYAVLMQSRSGGGRRLVWSAVSYDAKCLSKGCPTVTIGVKDIEYEE